MKDFESFEKEILETQDDEAKKLIINKLMLKVKGDLTDFVDRQE